MNKQADLPSPSGRRVRGEGPRSKIGLPPDLLDFARNLRTKEADAESLLWYLLRDRHRDDFIRDHGIEVVCYWNHDLMLRTESVLTDLVERAQSKCVPHPALRATLSRGERVMGSGHE